MWVTCTMYLLIIQIEVKSLLASLGELCCGCVGGERTLNLEFNKIGQTSAKQAAAARTEFFAYVLAIKLIHPKEKVVWSMILRKKRELSAELSCLLLHVIMMWLDVKNIFRHPVRKHDDHAIFEHPCFLNIKIRKWDTKKSNLLTHKMKWLNEMVNWPSVPKDFRFRHATSVFASSHFNVVYTTQQPPPIADRWTRLSLGAKFGGFSRHFSTIHFKMAPTSTEDGATTSQDGICFLFIF